VFKAPLYHYELTCKMRQVVFHTTKRLTFMIINPNPFYKNSFYSLKRGTPLGVTNASLVFKLSLLISKFSILIIIRYLLLKYHIPLSLLINLHWKTTTCVDIRKFCGYIFLQVVVCVTSDGFIFPIFYVVHVISTCYSWDSVKSRCMLESIDVV
jgi:hypothetical protein